MRMQRECQYDGWCVDRCSAAPGVMYYSRARNTAWCVRGVAVSVKKLLLLLCGCKHVKQYRRGMVKVLTFGSVRGVIH